MLLVKRLLALRIDNFSKLGFTIISRMFECTRIVKQVNPLLVCKRVRIQSVTISLLPQVSIGLGRRREYLLAHELSHVINREVSAYPILVILQRQPLPNPTKQTAQSAPAKEKTLKDVGVLASLIRFLRIC